MGNATWGATKEELSDEQFESLAMVKACKEHASKNGWELDNMTIHLAVEAFRIAMGRRPARLHGYEEYAGDFKSAVSSTYIITVNSARGDEEKAHLKFNKYIALVADLENKKTDFDRIDNKIEYVRRINKITQALNKIENEIEAIKEDRTCDRVGKLAIAKYKAKTSVTREERLNSIKSMQSGTTVLGIIERTADCVEADKKLEETLARFSTRQSASVKPATKDTKDNGTDTGMAPK